MLENLLQEMSVVFFICLYRKKKKKKKKNRKTNIDITTISQMEEEEKHLVFFSSFASHQLHDVFNLNRKFADFILFHPREKYFECMQIAECKVSGCCMGNSEYISTYLKKARCRRVSLFFFLKKVIKRCLFNIVFHTVFTVKTV